MKEIKLQISELQASILQRICKEEIQKYRDFKEDSTTEIQQKNCAICAAHLWDIIEQLCAQGQEEYWLAGVMNREDDEEFHYDMIRRRRENDEEQKR